MNCPTRDYNVENLDTFNQSPPLFNAETPKRALLGKKEHYDKGESSTGDAVNADHAPSTSEVLDNGNPNGRVWEGHDRNGSDYPRRSLPSQWYQKTIKMLSKYLSFVGPGLMVSVAYIDPGNYSTSVSSGSQFQYTLLFVILLSNVIACFLQSLAAKLGSISGTDMCTMIREHYPFWIVCVLYFFFECSIIATGIAEVIGAAIALNILLNIPLVAGCAITVVDTMFVLIFYRPSEGFRGLRYFELFVGLLVLTVVGCFCFQLAQVSKWNTVNVGDVFKGFLPSATVFSGEAIASSLGILGATVMPHSLILGTSIVLPRVRRWDEKHNNRDLSEVSDIGLQYQPSLCAIRETLPYSIAEVVLSLCTVAMFVNASILVVAGAALYNPKNPTATADLFSIQELLRDHLGKAAGIIFAVALLFSGISSSIIATMVGQTISEGFWHDKWKLKAWQRRLITRLITVIPCLVIASSIGRSGLGDALNGSQIALSCLLPFISFPLLHFSSSKKLMKVRISPPLVSAVHSPGREESIDDNEDDDRIKYIEPPVQTVCLANSKLTQIIGWALWLFISGLNMYLIVQSARGIN